LYISYSACNAQNVVGAVTGTEIVPGTVYSTGNIVQPTIAGSGTTPWVNGVYQDQLTCWYGGDPGYCGPNAIVRPDNNINFSYGSTYLYQQQHISSILPSETGLQVNGYNFSFTAKNGNGWDDGRTDQLTALVRFWDNTNGRSADNLLYGNSYNLSYQYNWTTFNYNETFNKPLGVPSIGQVQYGFIGRDNNFWAGPYGPEINNVSFSVKYSVDPCAANPLYSPTCSGYIDALAKLVPATTAVNPVQELAPPPPGSPPTAGAPPPPPGSTPPPGSPPPQEAGAPPPGSTPPPPSAAAPQLATATPSANNPQPKAGEVTSPGAAPKSTMSTSQAMSMISANNAKEANLAMSTASAAVSQAAATATAAVSQAESVAGSATAQSIASSNAQSSSTQTTTVTQGSTVQSGTGLTVSNAMQTSVVSIGGLRMPGAVDFQSSSRGMESSTSNNIAYDFGAVGLKDVKEQQRNEQREVEIVKTETYSTTGMSSVSMATERVAVEPVTQTQQTTTVKKNVQDNSAAGGVSIAAMATQPMGFNTYSVVMQDVAFYAPKEIYKNQRTVDNARAQRLLNGASDRVFQQMVDQQYNLGK